MPDSQPAVAVPDRLDRIFAALALARRDRRRTPIWKQREHREITTRIIRLRKEQLTIHAGGPTT